MRHCPWNVVLLSIFLSFSHCVLYSSHYLFLKHLLGRVSVLLLIYYIYGLVFRVILYYLFSVSIDRRIYLCVASSLPLRLKGNCQTAPYFLRFQLIGTRHA